MTSEYARYSSALALPYSHTPLPVIRLLLFPYIGKPLSFSYRPSRRDSIEACNATQQKAQQHLKGVITVKGHCIDERLQVGMCVCVYI